MSDTRPLPKELTNDKRAVVSLLGILVNQYIHQNQLYYSRTTVALGLQVAGFAAGWAGGRVWGGLGLLLVALITFWLWRITERDRECRNANLKLMRDLEADLLPGDEWNASGDRSNEEYPCKIRLGTPPAGVPAARLFVRILWILITADLLAAIAVFLGWVSPVAGAAI